MLGKTKENLQETEMKVWVKLWRNKKSQEKK